MKTTILEVAVCSPVKKNFHYLPIDGAAPQDLVGKRVKVPFGGRKLVGFVLSVLESEGDNFKLKEILEVLDDEIVISDETLALAKYISQNYICSQGEAFACAISPVMKCPKRKSKPKKIHPLSSQRHTLNESQNNALSLIKEALDGDIAKTFLIRGITASGKTEVYLNAIEYALSKGKSAIMLIPEISLTYQFIEIVQKRFGDLAGIWHSGISVTEKYRLFHKALRGEIKIMLGARSAVFAPFNNLGLIIIDEEHEHTYKQEQKPCYDAREIAAWRSDYHKGTLVFGSATPSLETYKSALDKKITLIEMPHRIDNKSLPTVNVLSLKDKILAGAFLLPETVAAISQALARKEQIIVFLNRRGFAPSIMCRKCETVYQCPHCSISMVYHKIHENLRCHYCGHSQKLPLICPKCGNKSMAFFGTGIQKAEDELQKLFPSARIFRLDGDSASLKGVYEQAYEGMKNERYDILLGTQMIAKGFDFPKVSLVCVLYADISLFVPDFKSAEKTFQLISQVAGRCGRGDTEGKVIIQTSRPEHYAIESAKNHDYEAFYRAEIVQREKLTYPPFCDTAKITVKNRDNDRAEKDAERFIQELENTRERENINVKVLGPAPSYIAKQYDIYRHNIIVKGKRGDILSLIEKTTGFKKEFSDTQIAIDISPLDLF